jgi:molybdenum cofactor cytidylyltransferase
LSNKQYPITQIAIVILAAGQSSRLGSPKQLLPFNGKSLLRHSVDEAVKTNLQVIVVIGANGNIMKNELEGLNITVAENKNWKEGMSTSLRCGLIAARSMNKDVDGIIFVVSDQPFVSRRLLNHLLKVQHETGFPIVACDYEKKLATPTLFHKIFFDELMNLQGDTGARKMIEKNKNLAASVPFPEGNVDIDTKEDYDALLKKMRLQK